MASHSETRSALGKRVRFQGVLVIISVAHGRLDRVIVHLSEVRRTKAYLYGTGRQLLGHHIAHPARVDPPP